MTPHKGKFTQILVFVAALTGLALNASAAPLTDEEVSKLSRTIFFAQPTQQEAALGKLVARNEQDVLATLILAMRYLRDNPKLVAAFQALTGSSASDWFDAMEWQQAHPEIRPHSSYRRLKLDILARIDPAFLRFLDGERGLPENMKVRMEEIAWGGVRVDGIPSLDNPQLVSAHEATYLQDDDLVFGVSINGDARAYPLRIMGWHEMFNDVIGGVPVALAYCTLCGAGILFETQSDHFDEPLIFGSSGFLYRSNKLMFDRRTNSLWNQFTGEPVNGPLVDSGIKLNILPVTITSWHNWNSLNPDTRALSLNTGHTRNYGSGVVYKEYFSSADLMFPALADENRLKQKDYVFGIRSFASSKAWPLSVFEGSKVINDSIGTTPIVLIGDAATRTVRAYERGQRRFERNDKFEDQITGPGGPWQITENELVDQDGTKLPRVAGHIAYWFAWDGYLGAKSELFVNEQSL